MKIDTLISLLEIYKKEGIENVSILRSCYEDGIFDTQDEFFICRQFEGNRIILISRYL